MDDYANNMNSDEKKKLGAFFTPGAFSQGSQMNIVQPGVFIFKKERQWRAKE